MKVAVQYDNDDEFDAAAHLADVLRRMMGILLAARVVGEEVEVVSNARSRLMVQVHLIPSEEFVGRETNTAMSKLNLGGLLG